MIKVKQVSIKKNKCFTVHINDLDPFLLDIKKKSSKDIDIYYINYIQENVNSSNPLRIKINSATGYLKKNDDKYLILDSTKEYEMSGQKLSQRLDELMVRKKFFMKKVIVKLASILKMICL